LVVTPGDIRRAVVERAGTLGQIASNVARTREQIQSAPITRLVAIRAMAQSLSCTMLVVWRTIAGQAQ
jgi:hypothetical protein